MMIINCMMMHARTSVVHVAKNASAEDVVHVVAIKPMRVASAL